MRTSTHLSLLPLTLASAVFAAQVDIFAVNYPVVAYILDAEPDVATTYLVACTKGTDVTVCPFNQPYVLTEGPKTLHMEFTAAASNGVTQSLTLGCDLEGTTSMGCLATGLAAIATGAKTTESLVWTGEKASTLFKNVEVVTNSASLMTYNRNAPTTTTVASTTSTSLATSTHNSTTSCTTTSSKSSTKITLTTAVYNSTVVATNTTSIALSSTRSVSSTLTSAPAATSSITSANGAMPSGVGSLGKFLLGGLALLAVMV